MHSYLLKGLISIIFVNLLTGCIGTEDSPFFSEEGLDLSSSEAEFVVKCEHTDAACRGRGPTPTPTPTPLPSTEALSDIVMCVASGTCVAPGPEYTGSGTVYEGRDHRVFQKREVIYEGESMVTNVQATYQESFVGFPSVPSGFTWVGSNCHDQSGSFYFQCFNLFAKYEPFHAGTPQTSIENSKYCVVVDDFGYCQNAPAALDPPSLIYRPTPTQDSVCFLPTSGDLIVLCHDLFVEKKQLP